MSSQRWLRTTARHVATAALFTELVACGEGNTSGAGDAGVTSSVAPNPSQTVHPGTTSAHASASSTNGSETAPSTALGPTTSAAQTSAVGAINSSSNTGVDTDSEVATSDEPDTATSTNGTSSSSDDTQPEPADAGTNTSSTSEPDSGNTEPTSSTYMTSEEPVPTDCDAVGDERAAVGYGNNATGGGAAAPVTVSSFAEAVEVLDNYRDAFEEGSATSLVVRYTGTFDFSAITDVCAQHTKESQILYIKEVENVTFEGAPGSSANFGIKINRAKNVIVRNMTMGLLPGGGDSDAITIEGNGTNGDVEHVWIDHNDLFSSTKDDCDGAGDTEFDGLIDIKKGARYITISYNKLHDHQKTGLLGSSDTDDVDRFVTFHHNWYENVVSRTPLHRFGYVHLFNNYFNRISDSGINVRMGGVALIEANYFENAANPVTSRYSDEVGFWDLRDNHVGNNVTWSVTEDTLANADDWRSTTTFPNEQLSYDYEPDSAECVKAIVMARAGATLD